MAQGQAADMRLVDDRLVIRHSRRPVSAQSKYGLETKLRGKNGALSRELIASAAPGRLGEQGLVPAHLTRDGLAVRVEQQLRRIAPVTAARRVRAVHAIPVALARADAGR